MPSGLSGVEQVVAGIYHTCALKSTGAIVCWGARVACVCGLLARLFVLFPFFSTHGDPFQSLVVKVLV